MDKTKLREALFRHLDGLVVTPVAHVLASKGIHNRILEKKTVEPEQLANEFNANEGYLNVALRVFCSQGWLTQQIDNKSNKVTYTINDKSKYAFSLFDKYKSAHAFILHADKFNKLKIEKDFFYWFDQVVETYNTKFQPHSNELEINIQQQVLKHIEGAIIGPIIVQLGMGEMFHKYFMESSFSPDEFHKNPDDFRKILDFLTSLKWFTKKNSNYEFTEKGLFYAKRSTAYGVTVSYLPMFRNIEEMLFGNPNKIRDIGADEDEKHVDREMNVWGSGGAHSTYFKVLDEIIIAIFNKPIEEQPKGILDMGCGNGAFLKHAFEVVERHTLRGKLLDKHPLFLVGADFNQAALKVTRANLIKADIWAKVIKGDIGKPELLAEDLMTNYKIELNDLLNVRTFLDHNRIWNTPQSRTKRISTSTGAYAYRGKRLPNNEVEDNLLDHFKKWMPYVVKHGLLLIELHTIPPTVCAENIGKTAATAYDATHGFSDQYILEIDVFNKIAKEAGLNSDKSAFRKFPNTEYATISINLLKK